MAIDCCDDSEYYQARYDATKLMIIAYETAIIALSTGGVQSYSLNTGQTQQTVTKTSLTSLKSTLSELESRLEYYRMKLCGGSGRYIRPGW